MVYPHTDTEPGEEAFRRLQGQRCRVFDDTADIIGQAAIGIRNISGAFKNKDLRILAAAVAPPATPPTITTFIYKSAFRTLMEIQ